MHFPTQPNQSENFSGTPTHHLRRLGSTDLWVSSVAMGCWPISGISSLGVEDDQSEATVRAALEAGVNFFDTAFSYGYDGRSDRILRKAIGQNRSQVVIAHKVGSHWNAERKRCIDGSRATLLAQAQECLRRLDTDYVDMMYLHTPDPEVSIEHSAEAIAEICHKGWARYAAVSNVNLDQAERFHRVCPVVAIQPHFNMFQQEAVQELRGFAEQHDISLICYWVLMKGLLAGHLERNHVFDPNDKRLTYPIFQGEAWQRAQDLLDQLKLIAQELLCTVSQLVIAWSLRQPNVTVALCGAKYPDQIRESARAMHVQLTEEILHRIDKCIAKAI